MWNDDKTIKKELWAIIIADFVLVFVLGIFIYFVFLVRIPEAKSLSNDILAGNKMEKRTTDILQMTKDTEEDRIKLSSYFVSKDAVVSFIEELESLSRQANVVLSIDSPLEGKDTPMSKQIYLRFNVRAEGRFQDVMHFVRLTEALPYKIFVDHVALSSAGKIWIGTVSFRLDSYINN